ncbi:hypothetical protein ONR75_24015 [Rhodopseudomonas sp. P2A-2r]|uniref:hyaluronate lyase N-terminal domain-containing protein n=1 Tax=Rhodopseudomonas sp. P2A-2r TaxID=2991972 RepID=UPI002234E0B0|nr:hypothetical protein [Rhodopseudomonas sp. P2A-2r]UZE47905.1 hypothetical protein ONR75_24015 [Rhodopseudomonas sp. P2A-2r]
MATRRQHIRNTRAYLEASFTPLLAEYAFDTTLNAIRVGDGATLGGLLMKRWGYDYPVSPAQITANQNDYSPTDLKIAETLLLNSDAARTITGLALGAFGRSITLINRGGFDITLANASASSTAANRFLFESDVVLRPNGSIELQYSTTDSRWMRKSGGTKLATIPQELLLTGVIAPAQIAANTNDYAPTNLTVATALRLSTDASRNLTGLVDPREGSIKTIINVGTNPLVLKNADAGSSAANRFDFGADVTLAAKQSATIRYDATDSRWKLLSATAGAAVAAGAVTAQTLAASSQGLAMINGTLVPSVAGSALTVAIKTLAGADPSAADPVFVVIRNVTPGTGDFVVMSLTAATSLTISSGSSMGVLANNTAFKLWIVGFNDAGTFRLGAINCLSGADIYPLGGWGIASSTAEGGAGAADSAQVIYTGTAVTAKAYATLGYLSWETGLAALSTWSAAPTRSQLFGPGVPLPGATIGGSRIDLGTVVTGTTLVPVDNTIPQNTEGDQVMAKAYTPQSAANLLDVKAQGIMFTSTAGQTLSLALYQDSVANALKVAALAQANTNNFSVMNLSHRQLAGLSVSTTFKVRAGQSSAGTLTFNASLYGGTLNSYLEISELAT